MYVPLGADIDQIIWSLTGVQIAFQSPVEPLSLDMQGRCLALGGSCAESNAQILVSRAVKGITALYPAVLRWFRGEKNVGVGYWAGVASKDHHFSSVE